MSYLKPYRAPTPRQLEERNYTAFVKKLDKAVESSYMVLGRGCVLDLLKEHRSRGKKDGLYCFYRRVMNQKNLVAMMESEFMDEAREASLGNALRDSVYALKNQKINSEDIYHRFIVNQMVFRDFGKLVCETAKSCSGLKEFRKALLNKLPLGN